MASRARSDTLVVTVSASEVADALRISRATAQRYLSQMADRKLVVLELQYGTAGRPVNNYRLVQ
jgi:response regulator of citrate/malate metabolism